MSKETIQLICKNCGCDEYVWTHSSAKFVKKFDAFRWGARARTITRCRCARCREIFEPVKGYELPPGEKP